MYLKKHLAKIILDTKFEHHTTQTCINVLLSQFKELVNNGIEKIKVIYLEKVLKKSGQNYSFLLIDFELAQL